MVFSKSFGYALRSILYVVMINENQSRVQIQEVADNLQIPKHFLGKIMKMLAKEKIIDSVKGPFGGFSVNDGTTSIPLIRLMELTDGLEQFQECSLRLRKCNADKPCPMHHRIAQNRNELIAMFSSTTVGDLIKSDDKDFIYSI
ncbi:MAG: Rrf2 family transcriptional regulator [Sphingobacteriales bacterium]|nr:Rrf2 family transcriptional regulator [Sphingobacteriales bacterium]MBI3717216.1 Rrf2 family transcriptional regulator [Sphingobacteriales bacterium]